MTAAPPAVSRASRGPRGARRLLAGILTSVCLLLAPAAVADGAVYFGATISGETYGQSGNAPANQQAWDLFERHAGKKVSILNTGQPWATFSTTPMDAINARGAIPMVTMGLGQGVTLADIASGGQDSAIRNWAKAARQWGHPFLFGPWWEMNGEWYAWGRDPSFVAAWRRFHDLVVAEGATNVTWTWIANSLWYDPGSDPEPWYPGDSYVDWVGIDSYNWGRNPAQPDRWINPDQTITPTLRRVTEIAPAKPVAIIENASSELGGNKGDWIREMLTTYLPHHPEIDAYLWFNWNFQKPNGFRADWPIESSAVSQQTFRKEIQSGYYRSRLPALPLLTKVPPDAATLGEDGPDPLDLSPGGQAAGAPSVAVAPDGTATVVWSARAGSSYAVFARRISPDGKPEATIDQLSGSQQDAFSPRVAIAPDGTATAVWIRSDGSNFLAQGRRIAPDGSPDPSTKSLSITGRDASEPQVAVAPDGTSTIVWKRFDGNHFLIQERRIAPDGTREETTQSLSDSHQDAVEPQVATGSDGVATVVWSRFDGANSVVQATRIGAGGTPDPAPIDLSTAGHDAVQPQVAVGPDPIATVVWTRSDGADSIVQMRRLPSTGDVEPDVANLSAAGRSSVEPQLAVGTDASTTIVWDRYDGADFVIQARRVGPGGAPEPVVALSTPGRDAGEPDVAVGPSGGATAVWSRHDGSSFVVQQRGIAPGGSPESPIRDLSSPGRDAGAPGIALGIDGAPTSVWRRFNGTDDIVQGITPPRPRVLLTPASYDFGSIALEGLTGISGPIEVVNEGLAPLTISSIAIGGQDPDQFLLSGTGACTATPIPAGASCSFSAIFRPSLAGAWRSDVAVLSNAPTSPDIALLSGSAHPPDPGEPPPPGDEDGPQIGDPRPLADDLETPPGGSAQAVGKALRVPLRLGRPRVRAGGSHALLPVIVPGAGLLSLRGAIPSVRVVGAGRTVTLRVRLRRGQRRRLRRSGRLRLRIVVVFHPTAGEPSRRSTTLDFTRYRRRH